MRLLNFVFSYFFLSKEHRPQLKVRTILISALVIVIFFKIGYKVSFMYTGAEYDLMLDALQTQNVTNYKIMCANKRINDSFTRNQLFFADHYLNLGMEHVRRASIDKNMHSAVVYDLNLTNIGNAVSVLKFCTMNIKRHFYSKTYQPGYSNFLYKRVLDEEDFSVLEINGPIFGGFHQPSLCIQDYLSYKSTLISAPAENKILAKNALDSVKKLIKQYDYDYSINRKPNLLAW